MEEFKLYSVSDDYVEWLRKDFPNVYSNKLTLEHILGNIGCSFADWTISLLCSDVIAQRFGLSDC